MWNIEDWHSTHGATLTQHISIGETLWSLFLDILILFSQYVQTMNTAAKTWCDKKAEFKGERKTEYLKYWL